MTLFEIRPHRVKMVKSQPDKVLVVTTVVPSDRNHYELPSTDVPPKIPPRMKKRGPALPEKPPHMRVPSSHVVKDSSNSKDVLVPLRESSNTREILVAGCPREKPVEKRQREPAKLLMPTSGTSRKEIVALDRPKIDFNVKIRSSKPQPILLIPRNMLAWGSTPVSYALWMQRDPTPIKTGTARRQPVVKYQQVPKIESSSKNGSVARSSSLTSTGSNSSDSGNETFPKSVLKKQKRSTNSKGTTSSNSSKLEQKKNVTFNAFATVQLMEE